MSVALHDHNLNHRGGWLVGFVAVLLLMTILHDTIRVFKIADCRILKCTYTNNYCNCPIVPFDGWGLLMLPT